MRLRRRSGWIRLACLIGLAAAVFLVVAPGLASHGVIRALRLDPSTWWVSAGFGAWGIRRIGLLLGGTLAGTILLAAGWRASGSPWRRVRGLHACASGTAMLEFTLVLPIALMIFLVVLQTALVYEANFHVSLAAYRGARAAMVWSSVYYVPTYPPVLAAEATERARAAAAWTCVPVSGIAPSSAPSSSSIDSAGLAEQTWSEYLSASQPWMGDRLIAQCRYAAEHTRVSAWYDYPTMPSTEETDEQQWEHFWRRRERIFVRVEHDYQLLVPYAARVMADRKLGSDLYVAAMSSIQATVNDYDGPELLGGQMPAPP